MKPMRNPAVHLSAVLLGAAMMSAMAAYAGTSGVSPAGFTVNIHRDVSAGPHRVFETITRIDKWWNSAHTWSGNAANLSLDVNAGGCFCERWGGNSVMHGQVIFVLQDAVLGLQSSLGPLQQRAVNGVLTFTTKAVAGKTALDLSYKVVGNADSGLDKMAAAVDQVLDEQMTRLASLIETGKPEGPANSVK